MEYGNGNIKVRIVLERPFWLIAVADDVLRPDSWYDVALLRDFALSKGPDVLPLSAQVKIFKLIWRPLLEAFSSSKKQSTLTQLDQLNMERMKRVIPTWSNAVMDLAAFLSEAGLVRRRYEAPNGVFSDRLMQYTDAVMGVRITASSLPTVWRVAIADASHPENWYDIALIRCLIEGTNDKRMPSLRRFEFVKENWGQIRQLFCDSCRETTHARLKLLLAEKRDYE